MKTYPLSMTRNYVARWGVVEAVRELIQNSLDSQRPFVYEFAPDENGGTVLSLHSADARLNPSMLLLGKTTKDGDPLAIGQFGEGFKLALLVLTREGHDVVIRNGPVDWCPFFERSELFGGEEQLVIKETDAGRTTDDLVFEVYGLSDTEVSLIISSCLLMQSGVGSKLVTSVGEILLERPGTLYVGNLYVCKTNMRFGYNVRSDVLKLDRDRQTVGSWDLGSATLRMWIDTKDWPRIAEMIDEEFPDVEHSRWETLPEALQKACYERFRTQNPTARVAGSTGEMLRLERLGARAIRVNSGMYSAISSYGGYRSSVQDVVEQTPHERLTQFRETYVDAIRAGNDQNDDFMAAVDRLVEESKNWSIE